MSEKMRKPKPPLIVVPETDEFGSVGFDTRALPWDQQYKLISSTVIPRPIALVSTDGPAGVNAAPFSFFNAVALGPPMVMFSIGPAMFAKRGEEKDTLVNVRATGEFVVQLVDDANKEKMNNCSPEYGADINEAHVAGFRMAPSQRVRAPRLVDCPVQLECVLTDIHVLGNTPYHMVIGEVVFAHYREGIVDDRLRVDMMKMNPIGRLANPGMYARITDNFQLMPPAQPAAEPKP
ncbi:flavin reductase family protein [Variovorax sp. J31P179]|uniref:flavin reductase family protein n=1 Tax=Variovorax sp. J31P179 TaxID=3053508 RepID=UPI002576E48E|nr:flavin reductase family protein [Variovorax sp. J31P179]MDM0085403.1 flavin reductase family protein [Variovorax sp. J31P179]